MAHRSFYWSCTSFANWIRGIEKGDAKTGRGWKEWEEEGKAKHPIRFWIAEEALDAMQNLLWWPLDKLLNLRYYIYNRWVVRTHACIAHPRNLQRGQWHDVGSRFLPCLFNELVDFVEIEIAGHSIAWGDRKTRKKYNSPFWASNKFHWFTWRCPQAGLDYLDWAMTLTHDQAKPTQQAVAAREIRELYIWWTEIYPKRPDSHDAGGWTAYCAMKRDRGDHMLDLENRTLEEAEAAKVALDKTHKIEKAYEAEDTAMLVRLMHVRNRLWV